MRRSAVLGAVTSKHTAFVIERHRAGRHLQRATVVGTVDPLRHLTKQTCASSSILKISSVPVRSRVWLCQVS